MEEAILTINCLHEIDIRTQPSKRDSKTYSRIGEEKMPKNKFLAKLFKHKCMST